MRMDRIEMGIVAILFILVANLWMLWDLPGQIARHEQNQIVKSAHAEGVK